MESKQEIREKLMSVLRTMFHKDGLTEEQLDFRVETILDLSNQTMDELIEAVEQGVSNGFTVDEQMVLIKIVFRKYIKS